MTLKWHGDEVFRKLRQAELDALSDGAEFLLEESNRTVPLEEGTLQNSGVTSVDSGAREAAISYNTPYAVRHHEHPEYNFQNGRRGKWLELTMQEQATRVQQFMAARIREALG